ncbi:hypothetical protein CL619_01605 [archaeon]|nr:hypothetical protein [archaeon]
MNILLLSFNLQSDVAPLGLAYLKSYANKHHPNTNIEIKEFSIGQRLGYETNKNTELQALSYIKLKQPDLVAFSCYIWSAEFAFNFARAIKQISPKTKVCLGGVEVDPNSLSNDVDFVIQGEGELAFKELIDYLKGQRKIEDVHNIITQENGKLVQGPKSELNNLDDLPFPYTVIQNKEFAVARVETSRGCMFNCKFCCYAIPKLRYFSLNYLRENLNYLFENFNFKYLTFLDANFNGKKERMFQILDLVQENVTKHQMKITVHIELRPELIDEETVKRFKEYNFTIDTELGLQSTNQDVLKAIGRPTNLDKVKDALTLLNNNHLRYKIDLMYALPQDNFYRFLESTRFILRHAKKQKKIVAHHYMQLNNSKLQQNQSIKRFNPNQSSMVIKTESQDTYDIYLTKLFLDQLNNELQYY